MSYTYNSDGELVSVVNHSAEKSKMEYSNTISYSYDNAGVRVSKNVNGVDYKYVYLGNLLLFEQRGDMKFYYSYDANGTLYSVKYTLTDNSNLLTYYFTHNSRGDIVGIYTGNGELRAKYEYDAWGNVVSIKNQNGANITDSTHIANLNPFRYRGYYLDAETGLYYLMSRYYDPVTHRFLNADGYFQSGNSILDTNMSAYCRNNPVIHVDHNGNLCAKDGAEGAGIRNIAANTQHLNYVRNHIDEYNRSHGTNYTGITDDGKFITANPNGGKGKNAASHAVSTIFDTFSIAAGLVTEGGKTFSVALRTALQTSGLFSALSVLFDSMMVMTDPFLLDSQKWWIIFLDANFAAASIGAGALIAFLTEGAGAHAAVCASLAIGIIGITVTTSLSENWGEENAKKWCPQSFN